MQKITSKAKANDVSSTGDIGFVSLTAGFIVITVVLYVPGKLASYYLSPSYSMAVSNLFIPLAGWAGYTTSKFISKNYEYTVTYIKEFWKNSTIFPSIDMQHHDIGNVLAPVMTGFITIKISLLRLLNEDTNIQNNVKGIMEQVTITTIAGVLNGFIDHKCPMIFNSILGAMNLNAYEIYINAGNNLDSMRVIQEVLKDVASKNLLIGTVIGVSSVYIGNYITNELPNDKDNTNDVAGELSTECQGEQCLT